MYIQPLQAVETPSSYQVCGDVTIHPSATIAPGVLLRAEPNCKIDIGPAACVGMGALLHACEGLIEVKAGANLGAGVLVVGQASIGSNSCIGASVTIRNYSVEADKMIPTGSLLGALVGRESCDDVAEASAAVSHTGKSTYPSPEEDLSKPEDSLPVDTAPFQPDVSVSKPLETPNPRSQSVAMNSGNHPSPDPWDTPVGVLYSGPPVDGGYQSSDANQQAAASQSTATVTNEVPLSSGLNGSALNGSHLSDPTASPTKVSSASEPNPTLVSESFSNGTASAGDSEMKQQEANITLAQSQALATASDPQAPNKSKAFGKAQVNRLMQSLFPHAQSLNGSSPSSEP